MAGRLVPLTGEPGHNYRRERTRRRAGRIACAVAARQWRDISRVSARERVRRRDAAAEYADDQRRRRQLERQGAPAGLFWVAAAKRLSADGLELICVDNGSKDGSVEFLRAEFPRVKVVALERNRGFTGGNEAGVREASGDVLVFLNNDMRVEPDCLRELVGALDADCSCAGARVLSWDGRAIDFIRGSLNFEGRGFQDSYGLPNLPELATPAETFFPNGGAFAVTRDAYDRAGGFDPAFFAYYDDVDLGWRLRLTGASIRVVGRAVVYHRHGATSRTQPKGQKRFLLDRNALWTLMKNYGESALRRTLGPALVLAIRRVLDESTLDPRAPLARTLAPFVVLRCRQRNAPQVWPARSVYQDGPAGPTGRTRRSAKGTRARRTRRRRCAACRSKRSARCARRWRRCRRSRPLGRKFRRGDGRDDRAILPADSDERSKSCHHSALPQDSTGTHGGRRTVGSISRADPPADHRTRGARPPHVRTGRCVCSKWVKRCRRWRASPSHDGATKIDDPRCTFATYDPNDPSGLKRLAEDSDVLLVQKGFTLVKFPFLKAILHLPIIVDLYCRVHAGAPRTETRAARGRRRSARRAPRRRAARGHRRARRPERAIDRRRLLHLRERKTQRDFWIGTLRT